MPLEATICMLDNSDYAINSDVIPTRLAAGADAVRTIFRAKTQSNPESTCGVMTFGGTGPVVLVSPTTEEGKIHVALPTVKSHGVIDLLAGLSVAGLALKHRQDKNQRQRAIVLLSSPLPASMGTEELTRLGKRLKKNNVAVDVILFGSEAPENEIRMRGLVDAVNSGGNSHFLLVPAGAPGPLGDHIKASEILAEEGFGSGAAGVGAGAGGGGAGAGGSGGDAGGFDLDPNLDPELAMALRMSLQEEEARQAALAAQTASPAPTPSGPAAPRPPPATPAPAAGARVEPPKAPAKGDSESDALLKDGEAMDDDEEDEDDESEERDDDDEELAKALAMSRGDDVEMGGEDEEMSEEEAIARAIEMSMNENKDGKK